MNTKILIALLSIVLLSSVIYMAGLNFVKADNNIAINYTSYNVDQIVVNAFYNNTPNSGYTYAIVNVTITNNGYGDGFNTNPTYFTATTNGISYNYDSVTFTVNNWQTVTVNNGGTYSGALVFQIPVGTTIQSMGYTGYYGAFQSFNIIYNGQASTPTNSPTPTATTNATPVTPEFPTTAVLGIFLAISLFAVTMLTIRKRKISKN